MKRFIQSVIALVAVVLFVAVAFGGPLLGGRFRSVPQAPPGWVCGPNGCHPVQVETPAARVAPVVPQAPQAKPSDNVGSLTNGQGETLGGVDRSTGVGSKDRVAIGGEVLREDGANVGALNLPEDSGKPFVVVVGSDDFKRNALGMLAQEKAEDTFHVVAYSPEQWQVKAVGYSEGIWFMGPRDNKGRSQVIAFEESIQGREGPLRDYIQALRKPDGIIDKKILPSLKRAVDPSAVIWDKVKPIFGGTLAAVSWIALAFAFTARKV